MPRNARRLPLRRTWGLSIDSGTNVVENGFPGTGGTKPQTRRDASSWERRRVWH
jgi:hypothetical protein